MLSDFVKEVYVRAGWPAREAEIEAEVLVWANLRGVDSHGVLHMTWYLENIDKGLINKKANIAIEKETSATLLIDADRALGPVATTFAMNKAMEKAKEAGIGWAQIRNLTHQGSMGYYSEMAAENDMAGIAIACHPPNTAPYGSRGAGIHNSPITISVPAKRHPPLNLDMANSVAAGGKIWLAIDKGISIPEGWGLDKDGNQTTDPKQVATLLPVGGPKGSGLALMFECLASVMVGNPLLEPVLLGQRSASHHLNNSIVAAINIAQFTDIEEYKMHIDNLIDGIKCLPKAEGFAEILVPGELEYRTHLDRIKNGIPLPEGTINRLRNMADKFGIKVPFDV
jgi:LDH2 family malate/lactate/ureidoglycolate dehydrogenase